MQKSPSEDMLQGQEVRADGVITMPTTGKFIKVKCQDCGNEQITYKKPAMNVACAVCGSTLVKSRGGEGEIRGELLEVVD